MYNYYKVTCLMLDSYPVSAIMLIVFLTVKELQNTFTDFLEDFEMYSNKQNDLPSPFNISAFWNANKG